MDKLRAKAEIEKLKQKLAQLKEQHKRNNDNHKFQLDSLKKSASIQTTPAAKQNAKKQIESKKQTWDNAKKIQASELQQILNQIERIKNSI
jgi:hypothetical protein